MFSVHPLPSPICSPSVCLELTHPNLNSHWHQLGFRILTILDRAWHIPVDCSVLQNADIVPIVMFNYCSCAHHYTWLLKPALILHLNTSKKSPLSLNSTSLIHCCKTQFIDKPSLSCVPTFLKGPNIASRRSITKPYSNHSITRAELCLIPILTLYLAGINLAPLFESSQVA